MARKYSKEEIIKAIIKVSEKNGIDPCFMIAKAEIESTFNNMAQNGSYAGLFQLSNGVGGCTGDSRFDPEQSTQCAINYIRHNRKLVEPKLKAQGYVWEDWMAYLCHQQGASGFTNTFLNPSTPISGSKRERSIVNNTKKAWKASQKTYGDFVRNWKSYFQQKQSLCANACSLSGIYGMSDFLFNRLSEGGANSGGTDYKTPGCTPLNYTPTETETPPTPMPDAEQNGGNNPNGNGGGGVVATAKKKNYFINRFKI